MDIGSLPCEVLAHIFSFLDWRSKLNVSSTCKQFMNAINYRSEILEDVCVVICSSSLDIFFTMSRNFCHFNFMKVDVNNKLLHFIEKFALLFRRLYFNRCKLSVEAAEMIRGKIKNCDNLWDLKAWKSKAFIMFSHLPKLKSLHIDWVIGLSTLELVHIQNMASATLTNFSLERARMRPRILYRFLDDFIQKRCQTLQYLNLTSNKLKSSDMVKLSRIEGLKLRGVALPDLMPKEGYLPGFPELQSIISFCHKQQTIMDLDTACGQGLDGTTLATICNTLPQIEGLTFSFQGEFDKNFSMIFQLKRLQRLSISERFSIRPDSFLEALNGFSCHDLKSLKLSCFIINDEVMSRFLPLVTNLEELHLQYCNKITDLTIFAISRWLTSLRVLELHSLPNISNDGLLGRAKGSGTVPVPLSNIKGLEVLIISECLQLTEDGLIEAIRFKQLRKLILSVEITVTGYKTLSERNSNLKILDF